MTVNIEASSFSLAEIRAALGAWGMLVRPTEDPKIFRVVHIPGHLRKTRAANESLSQLEAIQAV